MIMDEDTMQYEVDNGTGKLFKVDHNMNYDTTTCSCNQFMRLGLLCKLAHLRTIQRYKDIQIVFQISMWLDGGHET